MPREVGDPPRRNYGSASIDIHKIHYVKINHQINIHFDGIPHSWLRFYPNWPSCFRSSVLPFFFLYFLIYNGNNLKSRMCIQLGCARFPEFVQNFSEHQILWS